jgi:hypothetical protein
MICSVGRFGLVWCRRLADDPFVLCEKSLLVSCWSLLDKTTFPDNSFREARRKEAVESLWLMIQNFQWDRGSLQK